MPSGSPLTPKGRPWCVTEKKKAMRSLFLNGGGGRAGKREALNNIIAAWDGAVKKRGI